VGVGVCARAGNLCVQSLRTVGAISRFPQQLQQIQEELSEAKTAAATDATAAVAICNNSRDNLEDLLCLQ
jgi:hypothetical protein